MNRRSSPRILPSAPVGLLAVAIGGHEVILAWTESRPDGSGFHIERADGIGPGCLFLEIGRTGVNVAVFRDGSVKPGSTYSYRVHAWNATGDSSPSNVVGVTTPQAGTEPPADKE